ncbi:MAG: hypothetical protein WAM60_16355 [Candidatus Promineifilaceae bacterium]
MKHKILFLILIPVLLFVAACAAPSLEPAALLMTDPSSAELMMVRPNGATGELITYDTATGQEQFHLPDGFLSADESLYYAAAYQRWKTRLNLYNPRTGNISDYFTIDGEWRLDGMSVNGRWLVLTRIPDKQEQTRRQTKNVWQTEIQVFDTQNGRATHNLALDGKFEIDAISGDGTGLFLIQQVPPNNPDHYFIRAYDLSADELLPGSLRDKRFLDELMVGYPWGSISDPAGVWYLTLYINTQHNVAFIHALNMETRLTFCIDLPSGEGDFDTLQQYTLTLDPDEQKIYAANAALGIVAEVSLQEIMVTDQYQFPAHPLSARFETGSSLNASLITADGKTLYFTDGRQLWAYDTATGDVSDPLLESDMGAVQGLSVSDDGRWLYVAQAERPLLVLPMATDEGMKGS